MHPHRSMLKLVAVALAALMPATATHAAQESVSIAVVNNTTARGRGDIGRLSVACGHSIFSGDHQTIDNGNTLNTSCTTQANGSLVLSWLVIGSHDTITINCGNEDNPDWTDTSTVTLTFTGSGSAVTYTQSCTNLG